ncbi:MAG TPA: helix-turn-helix domain-containing protein [Ktedonobacteraceae bacterium]
MIQLRKHGMKNADIAAHVGMSERTIRGWLSRGDIPYSGSRQQRARLIDPYKPYLLERWHQGCRHGSQLERELRAKGSKGSQRAV